MTKEQFIKEIFEIAFGETVLTQELLHQEDYQTVVNKIMEYSDNALKWRGERMTNEDLYWWRVQRLWTMYSSITDDLVYKAMWERKLKELL
jgi:hypothetical protein